MWCHYCDKNNHSTTDDVEIATFKQRKKARFEAKFGPEKKSLTFAFEEIMHSKGGCNGNLKTLQASRRQIGRLDPSSLLKLME
jgi:hypothetical protein